MTTKPQHSLHKALAYSVSTLHIALSDYWSYLKKPPGPADPNYYYSWSFIPLDCDRFGPQVEEYEYDSEELENLQVFELENRPASLNDLQWGPGKLWNAALYNSQLSNNSKDSCFSASSFQDLTENQHHSPLSAQFRPPPLKTRITVSSQHYLHLS